MARPIWKGAVTFGLVTIPVSLYSAVERKGELSFRLLHDKDGSRIEYKRFCDAESIEVPWDQIVKGYEYEKGQYVVVTDEDFDKARVPATQAIEITDFVQAEDVDFLYFDQPYYLEPETKAGTKGYALLRDALEETGRIGIGTLVMRQREHLVAVEPAGNLLAVTTMRWAHEIRSGQEIDVPKRGEGWNEREMKLAKQLIDTLASAWKPEQYKDTYRDVLMQIIEKKIAGETVVAPKLEKPRPVTNLVDALERSLARKPAARAERREAEAKEPRPRRAGRGHRPRSSRRKVA